MATPQKKTRAQPAAVGKTGNPLPQAPAATIPTELNQQWQGLPNQWVMGLMFVLTALIAIIRLRLIDLPLERDEGEFGYMAQLLLKGKLPYVHAYNKKLPGVYLMYGLFIGLFGSTIKAIHLSLLVVNLASIWLVFRLGRKLYGPLAGVVAAYSFGLMSTSGTVLGFAAHATQYIVCFALLGITAFLHIWDKRANEEYSLHQALAMYFAAGFALGMAFIMKQPAVFFTLFVFAGALYLWWLERPIKFTELVLSGFLLGLGSILPYLLTIMTMYLAGGFDKFWFWTYTYPTQYGVPIEVKISSVFRTSFMTITKGFGWLWAIAFIGCVISFFHKEIALLHRYRYFGLIFFGFSFAAVCPSWLFREHYYIQWLPAVALMIGLTVTVASDFLTRQLRSQAAAYIPLVIFGLVFFMAFSSQSNNYFKDDVNTVSRRLYLYNPFIESIPIGKFIAENTAPTDKIAVLGSEAQLYYYSQREAATGYIYTYGLVDNNSYNLTMQKEMAREIEANKPKLLIYVPIQTSWLKHSKSPNYIVDWFNSYAKGYEKIGVVDLTDPETVYKFGTEALSYAPETELPIYILKRKS